VKSKSVSFLAGALPPGGTPPCQPRLPHTLRQLAKSTVLDPILRGVFLLIASLVPVCAQVTMISTLAGTPLSPGAVDESGSAARFNNPSGIAVDQNGNVFVTDYLNHTIRKISPDGAVTTWAGQAGSPGYIDGPGGAARFSFPLDLAIDGDGNLFVAEYSYIRKITPEGVVSTFAGRPNGGGQTSLDGARDTAEFGVLRGIAVDGSGNVYVTDRDIIRKITADGVVTTLAGAPYSRPFLVTPDYYSFRDGIGAAARFDFPQGIAVGRDGFVYVVDTGNSTVRKISPGGAVSVFAGAVHSDFSVRSVDGVGRDAVLIFPHGIALDGAGNLFVTESHMIRRIEPDGRVTTVAGRGEMLQGAADGAGGVAQFRRPWGIAIDNRGTLYVADHDNHTIRKGVIGPATGTGWLVNLSVRSFAGTGDSSLIAGFSVAGLSDNLGIARKTLLIRGIGATLRTLGVNGVLADPALRIDSRGAMIAENDNWNGDARIATAATGVGAFSLEVASKDAAVLITAAPGSYTAQIGGGTGIALIEIYDSSRDPETRLTNISARARVGPGNDILVAGFTITGDGKKTMLIRGIGPGLVAFGVSGVLSDPQLHLSSNTGFVGQNNDWGGTPDLVSSFARVGAFGIPANSKDAALLVTLAPGSYTVALSSSLAETGTALIEVYEVP
jgi:sugar lactone lactonase YvrE